MPIFRGQYTYSLDERGRVALPAKMREQIGDGPLIVTIGPDDCVEVHTESGFEERLKEMELSPNLRDGRSLRRAVLSNSFEVELDKQGRILLPQMIRETAGLAAQVVVTGVGEWIEIWDRARWDEESRLVRAEHQRILQDREERRLQ